MYTFGARYRVILEHWSRKKVCVMSNIKYDFKNTAILYVNYEEILEKKINSVCSKIGFDDSKITWFIFNPDEQKSKNNIGHIRIGYGGKDYGFCVPSENKIWISTLSIMKDRNASPLNIIHYRAKLPGMKEDDFLANVILDEITHIQTGYNHGSDEYDRKFQENVKKYYLSLSNEQY